MRLVPTTEARPDEAKSIRLPSMVSTVREITTRDLCFDLENRPLAYWYDGQTSSEITAFGWKWSDEDQVKSMLLQRDGSWRCFGVFKGVQTATLCDKDAYGLFVKEMAKADVVYGHNIRRHDLPMLNAGLLRRQLPVLPPLQTSDTCSDYPKRGGMSRSLENLASYYDLEGEKLKMTQHMWEEANRLKPDGIDLARERVESDVLLQERLRKKLADLKILGPTKAWRA